MGHREWLKPLAWGTLLLCLTGTASSLAAEPLTKLLSCRAIPDGTARLACFDRETAVLAGAAPASETAPVTAPLNAAPSHSPALVAPATVAADSTRQALAGPTAAADTASATAPVAAASRGQLQAAPAIDSTQEFGLTEGAVAAREVAAGTRSPDVTEIKARLTAISRGAGGLLTFTLDNGQVWRQLKGNDQMLASVGDRVAISRGWLHSFELQLPNGRSCKVDRLR